MSVGAGSIKRAAKAANAVAVNTPAEEVETVVEKPAEESAPEGSALEAEAATKPAAKKTAAKKAAAMPADKYEAYGVGQQLPTYLL